MCQGRDKANDGPWNPDRDWHQVRARERCCRGEPIESAADRLYVASIAEGVQGTWVNPKPHCLRGTKHASVFGEHLPGFASAVCVLRPWIEPTDSVHNIRVFYPVDFFNDR